MPKSLKSMKQKKTQLRTTWKHYFAMLALVHACIAAPLLLDAKATSYSAFILFCTIFLPLTDILSLIMFLNKNPQINPAYLRSLVFLLILSSLLGVSSLFAVYMIWQNDLNMFILIWSILLILFLYRLRKLLY